RRVDAERRDDPRDEPACLRRLAALGCRGGRGLRRLGGKVGHDARRLVAHAEQPALALGDDLETHRSLVKRGVTRLELAQRGPLRLADGLTGRLDGQIPCRLAHLRPELFFFLRRTWRGPCCAFGFSPPGEPPSPWRATAVSGFGGVRELRRSTAGAGVRCTSRRVISPCPTVQRFVVTQ